MVLDRAYSTLDGTWDSLNDRTNGRVLSDDLREEIRTGWRHFKPSSPVHQSLDAGSENSCHSPSNDVSDCISISAESEEHQRQNVDDPLFDCGLDGFRMPTAAAFSPPSVTSSHVNVIGDPLPSVGGGGMTDLDWWNYFDVEVDQKAEIDVDQSEHQGKKTPVHVNGVNAPSAVTDSPFWKVPKSSSIPNNDW